MDRHKSKCGIINEMMSSLVVCISVRKVSKYKKKMKFVVYVYIYIYVCVYIYIRIPAKSACAKFMPVSETKEIHAVSEKKMSFQKKKRSLLLKWSLIQPH